jgi:DNA helicase HerA-like ATPase
MNAPPASSSGRPQDAVVKEAKRAVSVASAPLGVVTEVHGVSASIAINPKSASGIRIGDLLSIDIDSGFVVGEVAFLQRAQHTLAEVRFVATFDSESRVVVPGAKVIPAVGSHAERCEPEVAHALFEDRTRVGDTGAEQVLLDLACAARDENFSVALPPEKVFGRHVAIVGSSGGGKSCSVARLVEECSRHRAKVVLLDLTGEYESLEGPIIHTHLGLSSRDAVGCAPVSLPYFQLTEADLVSILEPENALQLFKLRAAIKTLKLLHLEPKLAADGVFPKAHREKRAYEQGIDDFKHELQVPENLFDIYRLPLQIELECVDMYRSQAEIGLWGGINNEELAGCAGLIHRCEEILTRGDLGPIFLPHAAPSLINTLDSFLLDETASVLRVNFEFLPSIHHVREIVANAIGRRMLELGRRRVFMNQPALLVVDEAHQVLHERVSAFARDFPLDAYRIIAKEGRKYGLTVCVSTQRPGDIPEDIMSQIGTFFVHRLVGITDRAIVERATGTCDRELLDELPALGPGEALVVGSSFTRPLRVRMKLPERMPHSHGPNYQVSWKK